MLKKKKNFIVRIVDATCYSCLGLRAAWRNETAFRQETVAILIFLPAAFWLGTTSAQRAILVFSLLLIWVVELINSAIETVVDRISPEIHALSGQAKNLGSAAVLITLIATATVWGVIAWERLFG
ncbi:MAG: diacylglycerol kinase [Desulfatitalea sp. BRH_c12]|nr:MAG: diacylglycerol kinase [Desulfatitalea sp. BRH_c12]